MQLASSHAFPEPPLAAMWQLSENSRLGFRLAGSTLQQGFGAGKYLIAVGDTASVVRYAWPESLKAQQQVTAQSLAAQVPMDVKFAIIGSMIDSMVPNGNDPTGGFHEESGVAGTTTSGALVISPDQPGAYSNPDTSNHVSTNHTAVDQDQRNSIANVTVMWHIHPNGQTKTHNWNQPPSDQDRKAAVPGPINIVLGARDKTVYFYNSGNMNLHMSLHDFMVTQ